MTGDTETETDPMRAAQAGARPPLAKRFYKAATTEARAEGHVLLLDGRVVKTPGRRPVAVPAHVAARLAGEWAAQDESIDPVTMPLTRLVNTAIDGVATVREAVAAEIARYAGSDLLSHRADAPAELVARQRAAWDPPLAWLEATHGIRLPVVAGLMPANVRRADVEALREHIAGRDTFVLTALSAATTATGSVVLALAVEAGALAPDAAFAAATLDEDFQNEKWGIDAEAARRRADLRATFGAAVALLGR